MGQPVYESMCFLAKTAYFAFSLRSADSTQVGFDTVRSLLEKAATLRK
jgi:hypothetical protein